MTTADHTPSRACHLRGCPRPECAHADYRYRKQVGLEHSRGQYRMQDATQTSTHVQALNSAGWNNHQIADASGVLAATIQKLSNNKQKKISNERAAAILAVKIGPPPADERRVDATGTIRRLRALAYIGHKHTDIAIRLGMTRDRITDIATATVPVVRFREAEAIARLYRILAAKPGTSKQVATAARNKGWHGPLAWDDIDDPNCKPETDYRASRAKDGARRKVHADLEQVARLTAIGRTNEQIARELGCHERTVTRARRRAETALAA